MDAFTSVSHGRIADINPMRLKLRRTNKRYTKVRKQTNGTIQYKLKSAVFSVSLNAATKPAVTYRLKLS